MSDLPSQYTSTSRTNRTSSLLPISLPLSQAEEIHSKDEHQISTQIPSGQAVADDLQSSQLLPDLECGKENVDEAEDIRESCADNEDTLEDQENAETDVEGDSTEGGSRPEAAVVWTVYVVRRSPLSGDLQLLSSYLLQHWRGSQPGRSRRILLIVIETSPSEDEWSMEDVLDRLLQLHRPRGPPPASQRAIDSLPLIPYSQCENTSQQRCTICFDDYLPEDQLLVLPCKHFYHKDCLVTWLQQHNTCPVCRHEIEAEDADDEKERRHRTPFGDDDHAEDAEEDGEEEEEEEEEDVEETETEIGEEENTSEMCLMESESSSSLASKNDNDNEVQNDTPNFVESCPDQMNEEVYERFNNDWEWNDSWDLEDIKTPDELLHPPQISTPLLSSSTPCKEDQVDL